jgi:hypothetical protein
MPFDPADNNGWRSLAKGLAIPHDTKVVRIPDLHTALLDGTRYSWDRGEFLAWFDTHFRGSDLDPRDLYPEWRFNHQVEPDGHSGFSSAGRNSFLCLYTKLKHEDLWDEVSTIRWVGETGEMTFFPRRGSRGLQQHLLSRGYGDFWRAGKDSPWGVRCRFRGAQLHFRGFDRADEPDNVHIDLHNPGDPITGEETGPLEELPDAILHFVEDLHNRHSSHKWPSLRQALIKQGLALPPIVP